MGATLHIEDNGKYNLQCVLLERAVQDSADFVENYLDSVLVFRNKERIWNYAVEKIKEQQIAGVCLEFGVFKGKSINYFAKQLRSLNFIGFDSFEGLAEDWKGHFTCKGGFNLDGKPPKVRRNVRLVKGWYDKTLPEYCENYLDKTPIRFIHIDSDTYNSAMTILTQLAKHLKPGLLLLFDEFLGYPNWQKGEFLAWQKISKKNKIKFRYLSFAKEQALIEIIN